MDRIKLVDQPAGQKRCQEIAELTAYYRIIIMFAGVVDSQAVL